MLSTLVFDSPLGWILIASTARGLCLLDFCGAVEPSEAEVPSRIHRVYPHAGIDSSPDTVRLDKVRDAVMDYLTRGVPIPPISVDVSEGTGFRQEVWKALVEIPFGQTRTYIEVAWAVGRPRGARAVGQACGKNPVAIVIPCHRVLATGGGLGGYSSGLPIKKALLDLEKASQRAPS